MSAKNENSENWICQLPDVVYRNLLLYINNVPSLRGSCTFFRDKITLKSYPNFKSKNPKTRNFKLPEFGVPASSVHPLTNNRWVVIGDDHVISIMTCVDADEGLLFEQLALDCKPLEYHYQAKFLVAELPNNVLVVMNHHTFYLWDISDSEEPEERTLAGVYNFETQASAVSLVALSPERMAFAFDDQKIYIMNMKEGRLEKVLNTSAPVLELNVNNEGKLVVVSDSKQYEVCSFDPAEDFKQTQYRDVQPKKVMPLIKLSRILIKNHKIYADVYQSDGSIEDLWVSDRVSDGQYHISATKLGDFKSHLEPDARAIFWNTDVETKELRIQLKEYPQIFKFSI